MRWFRSVNGDTSGAGPTDTATVSCDAPIHKLNYIFSCHLIAQLQIKIGQMEGVREKPTYKELLNKPLLNFSGAMQHMDLYMTAQIFADGEPLCMPVKTSYKSMEPPPLPQHSQQQQHQHQHQQQRATPWVWDEWLTMPLKISDLPRNSLLALTAWDVESPQDGDVAVCGATIALFDKHGEFRQGVLELRLWPNRAADGSSVKTSTPGIVSDLREHEMDERQQHQIMQQQQQQQQQKNAASLQSATAAISSSASASATTTTQQQQRSPDEFPMLDELDRLAKMSKQYTNGHMIKQDWLDKMTFQELHNSMRREKKALSMAPASASSSSSASSAPSCRPFFLSIEFPQIRSDDVKYVVLYYEEDAERIIQTIPSNELFVVNDPELELDNVIELKHRKLEHSKQLGLLDENQKPDKDNKELLNKIVNYPVTRALKREEQTLMWKYRYYLTQNKRALTKFLQCFNLNLEFEGNTLMELMQKWQPMDVEDALELLGSKYKSYTNIRSYAVSRLRLASNDDLILYLLQLVQALRYENFDNNNSNSSNNEANKENSNANLLTSSQQKQSTSTQPATTTTTTNADNNHATNNNNNTIPNGSKTLGEHSLFNSNLKTFLLQRAHENEIVALCLYWFVKVEIKDVHLLPIGDASGSSAVGPTSSSSSSSLSTQANHATAAISSISSSTQNKQSQSDMTKYANSSNSSSNSSSGGAAGADATAPAKSNFQLFMQELLDSLRNGDANARSIYESIVNQERFMKSLNEVMKAASRESGGRDKKEAKLRSTLVETANAAAAAPASQPPAPQRFDMVNFHTSMPLIIDPSVRIGGINVQKTTMFKSNLMPCKFVFKALPSDTPGAPTEYATIYKIGDDLRQDQLVLQMIALMDKLLKQENLDLRLTPYKVIATGVKDGFIQFVDALPVSSILDPKGDYKTIREYLRKHNPSEHDKYGITNEAMENYVRSSAGYMVITYILGVGDRHYDNILITKSGKVIHIDFGYILGREPKPFQPLIKWNKELADGMGGKFDPDGKENKEYEDFKKYCYNAFLHLRRHANLILNLFSLMVDTNIPDIALEPDKTVKKLIDRFKLDINPEQASASLLKEIESNYDNLFAQITELFHTISQGQK